MSSIKNWTLLNGLVLIVGQIFQALMELAPSLLEAGVSLLQYIASGLQQGILELIASLPEIISSMAYYEYTLSTKSKYVTTEDLEASLAGKQNTIAAGAGLIKNGDTLSVDIPVHRMLTQDEYDALTDEEKRHGLFFIQNRVSESEETPEESASYAGEEDGGIEDTAGDITFIDSIRINGDLIGLNASNIEGLPSGSGFPSGGIIIWSGASDAVPSGWALCDGANGTPDLRDRFVVGAGSTYAVGAKGGEAAHTLTENEMPSHFHELGGERCVAEVYNTETNGPVWLANDNPPDAPDPKTDYTGGNQPHNNLPPYYALCYIMKL